MKFFKPQCLPGLFCTRLCNSLCTPINLSDVVGLVCFTVFYFWPPLFTDLEHCAVDPAPSSACFMNIFMSICVFMAVSKVGKGTIFIALFFMISDISLRFPSMLIYFPNTSLASSTPLVWHKYLNSSLLNFNWVLLKEKLF